MKQIVYVFILLSLLILAGCSKKTDPAAKPGTVEDTPPVGLKKVLALHEKLNIQDDEFIIYYVRQDMQYDSWALWMWALPDGDGAKTWEYTQNWTAVDGVAYMRFKKSGLDGTPLLGKDGMTGFIVRGKDSWIKDGAEDRKWNFKKDNACIVFSNDEHTCAVKEYKPRIIKALLTSSDEILLTLSGKYALDTEGGLSGFSLYGSADKYSVKSVYNAYDPQNTWNNFTDTVILKTSQPVPLTDAVAVYNDRFEGAVMVDMKEQLLRTLEKTTPNADALLGAHYNAETRSCRFALWAPTSEMVSVQLYQNGTDEQVAFDIPLQQDKKTGVWSGVFKETDPEGFFYNYTVKNSLGVNTVLDPYAYSMSAYLNDGGVGRGAIVDLRKKALKPAIEYPFVTLAKREDAIIYEVSVRDFTVSPDSGVVNIPGTYKAFIEKIPYLQKLGVTHIQLMPVLNFYYTDEHNRVYEDAGTVQNNNYNWGYDPHNYFTPEGWYASEPDNPETRIFELRELINECHKAGIGVLLDVVYNHMAKTDFLERIVPGYYFRTSPNGGFTSASGCGNDVASERTMARKLIVDSTLHWVQEYKADGFRFDLMGLLDSETVLQAYNECAKLNSSVLFIGEGWKMYNGSSGTVGMDQKYMTKTDAVAVFNDEFRDLLKAGGMNEVGHGFLTKKGPDLDRLFSNCLGFPQLNYTADSPGDNVQYLVCHDGLTLHDSIAHNIGLDEKKAADKKELIARIKLGNVFALTSQGIAFLHAGQERGRTKPNIHNVSHECVGKFVRNSYDASDSINQFVWTLDNDYQELYNYTAGLIALRKKYGVFRIGNAEVIRKAAKQVVSDNTKRLAFGYRLDWDDGKWFMLINASDTKSVFELNEDVAEIKVFVDENTADPDGIDHYTGISFDKNRVIINPCAAVIFRSKK